jgi:dTDP-4-dehydrorhamnose 3,5-epimerase
LKVTPTRLPEVQVIEPQVFEDERGWFFEAFRDERWAERGLPTNFRQDNVSRSQRHVLRGLHYQLQHPQGKLISCISGSAFDVAVDIRVGSPSFGKWIGVELTSDKPALLWIPPGFAHGFYARADATVIQYKCTDVYVPWDDHGILWCDAELKIGWPAKEPTLSQRDRELPTLQQARANLPRYSAAFAKDSAR